MIGNEYDMNKKLVLHVEDEMSHATLVKRWITKKDFPIDYVHILDGEDALDYLFHQGKYQNSEGTSFPDLILLDIRLPKISGIDVLKRIKSDPRTQFIPTIMLSTSRADENIIESYLNHANSYLNKNLDLNEFYCMIDHMFNYWLFFNLVPEDEKTEYTKR